MIDLIPRIEIFTLKSIIRNEISHIQNSIYENESDASYFENEEDRKEFLKQLDCLEINTRESIFKKDCILSINTNPVQDIEISYSNSISHLLKTKNCSELIWIAHLKSNLFGSNEKENNNHKLALNSIQKKLKTDIVDEALIFSASKLKNIIPFLYWSAKLDASVPEFSFIFDKNEQFQFHFCNKGNIHFTVYKEPFLTKMEIEQMGFTVLEKC